jgi:hypothetical protein
MMNKGLLCRITLIAMASVTHLLPARAADLPMRKGAPADYVRICSAHGAGFFYIPGSDVCLKIGGRVRAEYRYFEPQWSAPGNGRYNDATGFRARGQLDVDARTSTEYGVVRAFARYRITRSTGSYNTQPGPQGSQVAVDLNKGFIQFAGLTAGVTESFFDFYADAFNFSDGILGGYGSYVESAQVLAYTASFGNGFSATLSLEDRNQRLVNASFANGGIDPAGERMPDVIGALLYDQSQKGWGKVQLSGAVHQLNSGQITGFGNRVDAVYGYAVQLGTAINLPMLASGDQLWLQAAYSDGALSYLGINSSTVRLGPVSGVFTDGALAGGDIKTTRGWGATGIFLHYWTPSVRQSMTANYTVVDYDASVTQFFSALRDTRVLQVGSNLIWSPVKAMDIGVEVMYYRLDPTGQSAVTSGGVPVAYRGSADAFEGRLRLQRDF